MTQDNDTEPYCADTVRRERQRETSDANNPQEPWRYTYYLHKASVSVQERERKCVQAYRGAVWEQNNLFKRLFITEPWDHSLKRF